MNYKNIFYLTIALFLTSCGDDENTASLEDNIAGSWALVTTYEGLMFESPGGITASMVQSAWDNNQSPTLINTTVENLPDNLFIDTAANSLTWDSSEDCQGVGCDTIYILDGNNFTIADFNNDPQRGSFAFSSSGDMEYLQLDFETMFEGYIDDYDPNETDTELQGLIYEVVRQNYQRPR
jgi:hypothetical protein